MKKLLLTVTLAMTTALSSNSFAVDQDPAFKLVESAPWDGQMMMGSPASINLNFSDDVQLTALSLQLEGSDEQVDVDFVLMKEADDQFEQLIQKLDAGSYTIIWTAKNDHDGQQQGSIWFMVH